MRYVILILIFLFTSCKSSEVLDKQDNEYDTEVCEMCYGETEYNNIVIEKSLLLSSSPDIYEENVTKQPNGISALDAESITNFESQEVSEMNGTDQEIPQINYPIGKMAYYIPDTMEVGNFYDVKLRITKKSNGDVLINGLSENVQKIVINNIRVSNVMSATLIDSDGNFIIKTISTEEQNIEKFGFTEWVWSVKPIKSGENKLRLLIKVRVFTEDGDYIKDIPVYNEKIKVESNIGWSLKNWLNMYWQWLFSTIIIPIFIYFWKKRKKDKE